ncbi:hypothetical protein [Dyadobacter sp. NIV53]|uniref:hypothetical protein n=1 Tax=Dyadobacter sp. NIV53 TaxID=2861765 RepID=UPI001C8760DE|nr:hypothetical protein [Dyadobacter sp. NIV53]
MSKDKEYQNWLSHVELSSHENIYDLYNSVNNFEGSGIFYTSKEVTNTGNQYHVKADGNAETLLLDSDEDKFAFLNYLAQNYTDAEKGDIDTWYKLKTELGRID